MKGLIHQPLFLLIAKASLNKGLVLERLGRNEEALAMYDRGANTYARFPSLLKQIVDDAAACRDRLLRGEPNPEPKGLIAEAWLSYR